MTAQKRTDQPLGSVLNGNSPVTTTQATSEPWKKKTPGRVGLESLLQIHRLRDERSRKPEEELSRPNDNYKEARGGKKVLEAA